MMERQQSLEGLPPNGLTNPGAENHRAKGRSLIIAAAICVGLWLFFDSLAWLQNGGQVYSFIAAVEQVSQNIDSIDIDNDALLLPIMVATSFITVLVWYFSAWKFELAKRRSFLPFIGIVMGGAFVINFCFGGWALDDYMNSHAYVRCTARDHLVGHGKGEVWFIDYVRNPASCPGPTGYPKVERVHDENWRLAERLRAANKAREAQ